MELFPLILRKQMFSFKLAELEKTKGDSNLDLPKFPDFDYLWAKFTGTLNFNQLPLTHPMHWILLTHKTNLPRLNLC